MLEAPTAGDRIRTSYTKTLPALLYLLCVRTKNSVLTSASTDRMVEVETYGGAVGDQLGAAPVGHHLVPLWRKTIDRSRDSLA